MLVGVQTVLPHECYAADIRTKHFPHFFPENSAMRIFFVVVETSIAAGLVVVLIATWHVLPQPSASQPPLTPSVKSSIVPAVTPSIPVTVVSDSTGTAYDPPLQRFLDRHLDVASRVTNLATQLPHVRDQQQMQAVRAVLSDRNENDTIRHEAACLLRRSGDLSLSEILNHMLDDPAESERIRAFAAQHLGVFLLHLDGVDRSMALQQRLRNLLDTDRMTAVRREALLALVRVQDPNTCARVRHGLVDPSFATMRDCVIHCLVELDERENIEELRRVANSGASTPLTTRIAAIAALGAWRDAFSRDLFMEATQQPDQRLRDAGILALRRLDRDE